VSISNIARCRHLRLASSRLTLPSGWIDSITTLLSCPKTHRQNRRNCLAANR